MFKSLLSCICGASSLLLPDAAEGWEGKRGLHSGLAQAGAGTGPARRQAPHPSLAREDQSSKGGISVTGQPPSSASAFLPFPWEFCLQKSPRTQWAVFIVTEKLPRNKVV